MCIFARYFLGCICCAIPVLIVSVVVCFLYGTFSSISVRDFYCLCFPRCSVTLSKVFPGNALPDSVFCFTSPTMSATVFRVGFDAGGKHGISCCAHYVLTSWFMWPVQGAFVLFILCRQFVLNLMLSLSNQRWLIFFGLFAINSMNYLFNPLLSYALLCCNLSMLHVLRNGLALVRPCMDSSCSYCLLLCFDFVVVIIKFRVLTLPVSSAA